MTTSLTPPRECILYKVWMFLCLMMVTWPYLGACICYIVYVLVTILLYWVKLARWMDNEYSAFYPCHYLLIVYTLGVPVLAFGRVMHGICRSILRTK